MAHFSENPVVSSGGGAGRGSPEPHGAEEESGALGGSPQGVGAGGAINEVMTIRGKMFWGEFRMSPIRMPLLVALQVFFSSMLLGHMCQNFALTLRKTEKMLPSLKLNSAEDGSVAFFSFWFLVLPRRSLTKEERKGCWLLLLANLLSRQGRGGDATPSVFRFG